jgi:hypothetical protein
MLGCFRLSLDAGSIAFYKVTLFPNVLWLYCELPSESDKKHLKAQM